MKRNRNPAPNTIRSFAEQEAVMASLAVDGYTSWKTNKAPDGPELWSVDPFWKSVGTHVRPALPQPGQSVEDILRTNLSKGNESQITRSLAIASSRSLEKAALLKPVFIMMFVGFLVGMVLGGLFKEPRLESYVRFSLAAPDVRRVAVVGDFNQWDASATPMYFNKATGQWQAWVNLAPGRYRYAFLLEGETQIPDPFSGETVPDGKGGGVSLLLLPEPGAPPANSPAFGSTRNPNVLP